jgi:alkanesulfonate monooxygenase SsuD/methylene tetrahydromethanopterin reductase-like flavin-dependent oxidoreductase (luciferase family)
VHLAHLTKNLRIGCGFNITPMWHPLRLAEDFATADILTKGRTVFGVGRGYHSREVETFGAPMLDQEANRELFEEQVEILFKAFNNESFSHHGKHYTLPPEVPYRGYQLKEISLVPRPVNMPVECWQPIVSAQPARRSISWSSTISRARSAAAPRRCRPARSRPTSDAASRAGKDLKLGENLMLGVHGLIVAKTREEALRRLTFRFMRSMPRCSLRSALCRA